MIWQPITKPNTFGNGLPGLEPPEEVGVYFDETTVSRIDRNSRWSWMLSLLCMVVLATGAVLWKWWEPHPSARQAATPSPISSILTTEQEFQNSKDLFLKYRELYKNGSKKLGKDIEID